MEKKDAKIREKYISPVVEALPFVMEKGFAASTSPTLYSVGSETNSKDYAGEQMENESWNLVNDNQISF